MQGEAERVDLVETIADTGVKLLLLRPMSKVPVQKGFLDRHGPLKDDAIAHSRGLCSCSVCEGEGRPGNLGIQTGNVREGAAQLRVNVIDVDLYKGNGIKDRLEELDFPRDTWIVKTSRGGLHYYFLAGVEMEMISRANHKALGPGFDTKGRGGYIVCPPSVFFEKETHRGGPYSWAEGHSPLDIPLPIEMPRHLANLVMSQPKKASPMVDTTEETPARPGEDPLAGAQGAQEGNRNDIAVRLALKAIRSGVGIRLAWESFLSWNNRCDPPEDENKVQSIFEWAKAKVAKEAPELIEDTRSVIFIADDLEASTESAEEAMSASYPPGHHKCVYWQGRRLVTTLKPVSGQPVIHPMEPATLKARLSSCSRFMRVKRRDGSFQPIEVIHHLLKKGQWDLPELRGIRGAPYMRPDGEVVCLPGYDETSGYLAHFGNVEYQDISKSKVTREEAEASLETIKKPLAEFPWATEADLAAALAILLTIVARPAILGNIPLFAIRAHAPGTGKTLLAQCLVAMGTGVLQPVSMPVGESEETRKRLFTMAIEGKAVVIFDNEEGVFGSKALSSILTSGMIEDRVLGSSKSFCVPWTCVTIVTGNNLTFRSDQGRRTMICDLVGDERPEERGGFKFPDLLRHCLEQSSGYILDSLRVLKGYRDADERTRNLKPFGSFEAWTGRIRQTLVWLEQPDPILTRSRIHDQGADTDEQSLVELHLSWMNLFGSAWITSKDASKGSNAELRDIVGEITDKSSPASRDFGYALRKFKGRVLYGARIESRKGRSNVMEWRIAK